MAGSDLLKRKALYDIYSNFGFLSRYLWQGKVEEDTEVLLVSIFKYSLP